MTHTAALATCIYCGDGPICDEDPEVPHTPLLQCPRCGIICGLMAGTRPMREWRGWRFGNPQMPEESYCFACGAEVVEVAPMEPFRGYQ